jgi:hypothetical protein
MEIGKPHFFSYTAEINFLITFHCLRVTFLLAQFLNLALQDWRPRSPKLFHNVGVEYKGDFFK